MTLRRALAAGLLFAAFGAFTVFMSYPIDCHEEAWVVLVLGVVAAVLAGGAVLVLLWNRQNRWWMAALSAILVGVVLYALFFLRAAGTCLE